MAEKIGAELERFPVSDTSGIEQNLQVFSVIERLAYVFVGVLPGFAVIKHLQYIFGIAEHAALSLPMVARNIF